MTASDCRSTHAKKTLASRGPSTHDPAIHGAAGNFVGRIAPIVIAMKCDATRATPMDRRVKPGDDNFTWRPTAQIDSLIA